MKAHITTRTVSAATIARTAVLALALINQILSAAGKPVLPIESAQLEQLISTGFTTVSALVNWWFNNSFTKEAIQAVIDGKFTAGSIEKGIAEDSLYLDFDGSAYEIPAEVMEQYDAVVAAIKDGTIVVPSTIEDAKAWQAAA